MATSITVSNRYMIDELSIPTKIQIISPITSTEMIMVVESTAGKPLTIKINDDTDNNYTSSGATQRLTVSSTNIASTIVVSGDGPASYTINIQDISPTSDFIPVTRAYNETSPIVLRLPLVTERKLPIFIKLARSAGTAQNDGVYIMTRGDSFIDFQTRDIETNGIDTFIYSNSIFIGGQSADGTSVNYPCITLFSDGTTWYVANYYPMHTDFGNNQFLLSTISSTATGDKVANANPAGVNIFKNNLSGRELNDNTVLLQTPTSISICIVVYGGSQGDRNTSNRLLIKDSRSGSFIDGFAADDPFILIDGDNTGGNAKSSGIVLLYDTTGSGKWYVIGWYYPYQWTWGNSPATYGSIQGDATMKDSITPAGEERKILVTPDLNVARFYTLPLETASNPQLIILKARDITTANLGLRYTTQYGATTNDNRINTGTISIKYGSSDSSSATSKYSCVWFVSEQVEGESFLSYYPVVAYVPFP